MKPPRRLRIVALSRENPVAASLPGLVGLGIMLLALIAWNLG
jgi:hypothetical protein